MGAPRPRPVCDTQTSLSKVVVSEVVVDVAMINLGRPPAMDVDGLISFASYFEVKSEEVDGNVGEAWVPSSLVIG